MSAVLAGCLCTAAAALDDTLLNATCSQVGCVPADPGESTKMVLDGEWIVHMPKLGWWLACEGNLAYFMWHLYQPEDTSGCEVPNWQQTSSSLIAVRSRHMHSHQRRSDPDMQRISTRGTSDSLSLCRWGSSYG